MELPVNNQVISSLINASTQGRKTKYVPIGPDLRYIGRLPGSNVNNFEEEYLLGEDKQITRSYTVDDDNTPCYKEVIKYRKNDSVTSNYYELECFEYDLRPQREDITVDDDKMIINLHSRLENLPQADGTVLRKYNLYQYPASGERELVSQKVVESRFLQDNNKRKWIEIIRKQSGPAPLDSNIIFENGAFNPNRVPEGFDQLDNSVIPLPQSGYTMGKDYILNGAASQYVGTNKILITTGSNGYDADIINEMICHTGNTNDQELSGRGYFLPVVMQSLQDEGYTKLKIAVGISGYGIPGADPEHLFSGILQVYLQSTNSPTYSFVLNGKDICEINDLAENPPIEIYEIDLSGYQSYVPSYLFLGFVVGTSHIQKIQFE